MAGSTSRSISQLTGLMLPAGARVSGNSSRLVALVHKAFRITEVCDPGDRDSLNAFLDGFQQTYRGHVRDALALATQT